MTILWTGLAALNTILWGMGGLDWIGDGEEGGGVHGFVIAWMIIVGLKVLVDCGEPGGGVGGGVLTIWMPGDLVTSWGGAGDTCNGDCNGDSLSGGPRGWRNIGAWGGKG